MKLPAEWYVCCVELTVELPPSPKYHVYQYRPSPPPPVAEKSTVSGAGPDWTEIAAVTVSAG